MSIIPTNLLDIELMRLCFSEDIALGNAAMKLFDIRYRAHFINRAKQLGFSQKDSESSYVEVFMTAYEKYKNQIPNPNLKAYMFTILNNMSSKLYKEKQKYRMVELSEAPDEGEDPIKDAEDMELSYEKSLKVQAVYNEMKPDDAFLLANWETPRKELAEKLGITENNCKVRINRAKEKFEDIWAKKFGKNTSW